jgi:phosphoglycerol transferase MdoB-like AlkP superfamily enzyme
MRMMRLLITIAYENITVGLALTAFTAYVSSVVSKRFSAIQYALLSSLTFLSARWGAAWRARLSTITVMAWCSAGWRWPGWCRWGRFWRSGLG